MYAGPFEGGRYPRKDGRLGPGQVYVGVMY